MAVFLGFVAILVCISTLASAASPRDASQSARIPGRLGLARMEPTQLSCPFRGKPSRNMTHKPGCTKTQLWRIASWFSIFVHMASPVDASTVVPNHARSVHLPLVRRQAAGTSTVGLGNYRDVTYNTLVNVGGQLTPLVIDTGSADMWVLSDACGSLCQTNLELYMQSSLVHTGLDARLHYGDSRTGTHAFGVIGRDEVSFAGFTLSDQYFASINDTDTNVLEMGSTGIFGLGFPFSSIVWGQVFDSQHPGVRNVDDDDEDGDDDEGDDDEDDDDSDDQDVSSMLSSFTSLGPFLSRVIAQGILAAPMVTITLQRDYVDVGGNAGMLSIGGLPDTVSNDSVSWFPLRAYSRKEGGPSDDETYPLAWEVFIDRVYLDGQELPATNLTPSDLRVSALVDTGNSLIRGPEDVVEEIRGRIGLQSDGSGTFSCDEPHKLEFEIGGRVFPMDPRDFVSQAYMDSVDECVPNLAITDTPEIGDRLHSWSLGDPFLKGVLASFYYGNLTHPSADPQRLGLLSTVPDDAEERLLEALREAEENGGNLPETSHTPPTATPTLRATNSLGVPLAESDLPSSGARKGAGRPLSMFQTWLAPAVVAGGGLLLR